MQIVWKTDDFVLLIFFSCNILFNYLSLPFCLLTKSYIVIIFNKSKLKKNIFSKTNQKIKQLSLNKSLFKTFFKEYIYYVLFIQSFTYLHFLSSLSSLFFLCLATYSLSVFSHSDWIILDWDYWISTCCRVSLSVSLSPFFFFFGLNHCKTSPGALVNLIESQCSTNRYFPITSLVHTCKSLRLAQNYQICWRDLNTL